MLHILLDIYLVGCIVTGFVLLGAIDYGKKKNLPVIKKINMLGILACILSSWVFTITLYISSSNEISKRKNW